MWFLTIISYVSMLVQIVFITIAIAAGLYYLAEVVEEHTSIAKKCIWWMNSVTATIYVMLWLFENFPLSMVSCGLAAQVTHFVILIDFPYVALLSPSFIIAVLLIILNHYLAFVYFASIYYSFSEVMAYFTLCLWLVPFSLFVSLSANDYVLPTTSDRTENDVVSNYFSKKKKYGLLTFFNFAKESVLPVRTKKGF